jgi:hypothetical protein
MAGPVEYEWQNWRKEELLDLRLCDLGVRLEGTWVERLVDRVRRELTDRGIRFRPHFWVGDEWCSPDGVPGVAIPFYLLHPRLTRLEQRMMFEAEGSTRVECLMLLRHEMGHAFQHAYELQRKPRWRQTFGRSTPYPEFYKPNPMSKRFVYHLPGWYAQSHPAEDFAETFAVWLNPRSRWQTSYKGWPALRKLHYVDQLMSEIGDRPAKVRTRKKPYSLKSLHHTLREHYEWRRKHYDPGFSGEYDRDLLKLFSAATRYRRNETAASFIRRNRRQIREQVAIWTGEYQMTVDLVLKEIMGRCKELKLRLTKGERPTKIDFVILLTVHTVQLLNRRDNWHPV